MSRIHNSANEAKLTVKYLSTIVLWLRGCKNTPVRKCKVVLWWWYIIQCIYRSQVHVCPILHHFCSSGMSQSSFHSIIGNGIRPGINNCMSHVRHVTPSPCSSSLSPPGIALKSFVKCSEFMMPVCCLSEAYSCLQAILCLDLMFQWCMNR